MNGMEAAMTLVRLRYCLAAAVFLSTLLVGGHAAMAADDDGQWTMPGKDYAATRYSGLTEINAQNAKGLHPVWTFSTGVLGGHQGQPLVVNNTMYVVTPYPNVLYAFDLTKEGYPLRWKYRPAVSPNAVGVACCDAINRGASYADGKIFYNLLDGHTVAVDAKTGRELWVTQIADMSEGETTPMAPLVTKDRVIVGASGGEFGIYGWLKGLDLKTGKIVWTGRNIGPDAGMLIKPGVFKSFYDKDLSETGLNSWPKDAWKTGGAPVWGWVTYDPELDLLYYGSGNPSPYNTEQRAGDNKWSASVLARRPSDGSLVWAYQFTPHDNWDYDATSTMVLVDLTIGGKAQKDPGRVQQERLPVHPRPDYRGGTGGHPLRGRQLGEERGSEDRPPGARSHQADRRLQRTGHGRLPESRRWSESSFATCLLAADGLLLHIHQQPLHGLQRHPGEAHGRHAVPQRQHPVPRRPGGQGPGGIHRVGPCERERGCGRRTSRSLPGAVPWSRLATWRSTAPWTDGSSRSTRRRARFFRSSRWGPE